MLKKSPRAPVLIVGGGAPSIGLFAAGITVAMGASQVDYPDTSNHRLDLARELGANPVKITKGAAWFRNGEPPGPEKPLITVDASSFKVGGLNYAIRSLAPGGKCTSVCFYFRKGTPLPLLKPIGDVPPAEYESDYYRQREESAMAA
jgi:threonine dehydrogenase-like Zn-dependent dehydrogenase